MIRCKNERRWSVIGSSTIQENIIYNMFFFFFSLYWKIGDACRFRWERREREREGANPFSVDFGGFGFRDTRSPHLSSYYGPVFRPSSFPRRLFIRRRKAEMVRENLTNSAILIFRVLLRRTGGTLIMMSLKGGKDCLFLVVEPVLIFNLEMEALKKGRLELDC